MIKEVVNLWEERKYLIEANFLEKLKTKEYFPDYEQLFTTVLGFLKEEYVFNPDVEKLTVLNHGNYQGTLVFIVPEEGYQPSKYYYAMIDYGSCSGCDTLECIHSDSYIYDDDEPEEIQQKINKVIKDYMTLSLHIVQRLKVMNDED